MFNTEYMDYSLYVFELDVFSQEKQEEMPCRAVIMAESLETARRLLVEAIKLPAGLEDNSGFTEAFLFKQIENIPVEIFDQPTGFLFEI